MKRFILCALLTVHEGDANGPLLGSCRVKATGGKWSLQNFKVNIPQGVHKITFTTRGSTEGMKLRYFLFE